MTCLRIDVVTRWVAALLLASLLLPTLAGCASRPAAPPALHLAGIVVDGMRIARPGEAGLVWVTRDGQRLEARSGMPLRTGDRLETGPSATAVVRWPNGNELMLRPNSSGRLGSLLEAVGEFFAKVRGQFAVETQFVRAGALGTQYLVRTGPGGATTVIVFDGQVEVGSTRGAWPSEVHGAGVQLLAHPRSPVRSPAAPDELRRTREWVEQVERLVPTVRTSSSSSTAKAVGITAAIVALGVILADRDSPSGQASGGRPGSRPGERPGSASVPTQPSPPATAPGNPRPGSGLESQAPSLLCERPLSLAWDAVPAAGDYQVQLEARPAGAGWRPVWQGQQATATSIATAPALSGLHRWRVWARNAAGSGPASSWLHFSCSPFVLR